MNYNQFNRVGACPLVNFDKSRKVYNNPDQLLGVTHRVLVVTMKVFLVLALAIASVSAGILPLDTPIRPRDLEGVPSINGRITNGKNAAENQFPYQVGLSFASSSGSWWCGGSIIASTYVLTAAHCTEGLVSFSNAFLERFLSVLVSIIQILFRDHLLWFHRSHQPQTDPHRFQLQL